MLPVLEFLGRRRLGDLTADLGIDAYRHPALPLVGLKYDQLASPKNDPIVRDCRGIVLEECAGGYKLVAKPFRRFFNAGEDPAGFAAFDWGTSTAHEKVDGSLIIVYHYQGQWHANTSGSFGLGECSFSGKSWRQLFWEVSGLETSLLDPLSTYLFEMWTPYNKVVRTYPSPRVWLLAIFSNTDCSEVEPWIARLVANKIGVRCPEQFYFTSQADMTNWLSEKSAAEPTYEGLVLRSSAGERYKVKTDTYLAYHHLLDNGNLFNPNRLVLLVLAGESDEVLAYFPEMKEHVARVSGVLDAEYRKLLDLWRQHKDIPNQKDFAVAVVGKSSFTGLLFDIRKRLGAKQTEADLDKAWRQSADAIVKRLF